MAGPAMGIKEEKEEEMRRAGNSHPDDRQKSELGCCRRVMFKLGQITVKKTGFGGINPLILVFSQQLTPSITDFTGILPLEALEVLRWGRWGCAVPLSGGHGCRQSPGTSVMLEVIPYWIT